MSTNHNRIKVADLEKNQPDKILTTNQNGELEFSNINNIKTDNYNGLDYSSEGKALDARQGKVLKDSIDALADTKQNNLTEENVGAFEGTIPTVTTIVDTDKVPLLVGSLRRMISWTSFKSLFKTVNEASLFGSGNISIPDMDTTTAQTISGVKTFLNGMLGFRNSANTFTSFFSNNNTASRNYLGQDKDGTLAFTEDLPLEKGYKVISGNAYTFGSGDGFCTHYSTFIGNVTITIPNDSSYNFIIGTKINLVYSNSNSGAKTIVPMSGVTLIAPNGLNVRYGGNIILTKVNTNTWLVNITNIAFSNSGNNITTSNNLVAPYVYANSYLVSPRVGIDTSTYLNFTANGVNLTRTSNYTSGGGGTQGYIGNSTTFAPTAGNTTAAAFIANPTINQTGSANGITRGFLCDPILTSAVDFRAIDCQKGSIVLPLMAQSSTYAINTNDYLVQFTSGTFTATLPTAVGCTGKTYILKNSGSGVVTIATTSSQTIDGTTTYILSMQYKYVKVVSDGSNWAIIGNN